MIGGGGWIQNVVFTADSHRLYSYVDIGGFYRSDDGGALWRMMMGGLPSGTADNDVRGVSADPSNADLVLVACGDADMVEHAGVFRSTDGGQTLRRTLAVRFGGNAEYRWAGFILVHDPKTRGRVFAASMGDGIFRSDDGGSAWSPAGRGSKGINFTGLTIDRRDPATLWASAQPATVNDSGNKTELSGGFWRSKDAGESWVRLSETSPEETVQDPSGVRLWGLFNRGLRVRASDDGGATWADASGGLRVRERLDGPDAFDVPDRFYAIAAGPDFTVLAAFNGDIFTWRRGTAAWVATKRSSVDYRGWTIARHSDIHDMFAQNASSIVIDPNQPAHWFMTDAFAIYETRDAGVSWRVAHDGIEATVVHCICPDPVDPARVYLGMGDDGGFTSEDGGVSYRIRQMCSNVKDFAVSPALPARVYALGTGGWEWRSNQVFVSIDGGANWSRSPMLGVPDMAKTSCNSIAVDPTDPYTCMLAVSGALKPNGGGPYLSKDGGKTWVWMGEGLPEGTPFFSEIIWVPGRQIALGAHNSAACAGIGRIFIRDNQKKNWQEIKLPHLVNKLGGTVNTVLSDPAKEGDWLAAGDAGVFRISGTTPTRIYENAANQLAVDNRVKGRLAASTAEGVVLSVDGGATWQLLDKALPIKSKTHQITFAGERLLVGSGGFGAFWLPLSDAGREPMTARPVAAAPARSAGQTPVLHNLDFSQGANGQDFWEGDGGATLRHEVATPGQQVATHQFCLKVNKSGGQGGVRQNFTPTFDEFSIAGKITTDETTNASVAVQVFDDKWKQIAWISIANLRPRASPLEFCTRVNLPSRSAHAALLIRVGGSGEARFSALEVAATPPPFP